MFDASFPGPELAWPCARGFSPLAFQGDWQMRGRAAGPVQTWSERPDSNRRPLDPQSSALPSCATLRTAAHYRGIAPARNAHGLDAARARRRPEHVGTSRAATVVGGHGHGGGQPLTGSGANTLHRHRRTRCGDPRLSPLRHPAGLAAGTPPAHPPIHRLAPLVTPRRRPAAVASGPASARRRPPRPRPPRGPPRPACRARRQDGGSGSSRCRCRRGSAGRR